MSPLHPTVAILGSTGSIGTQTIDIVRQLTGEVRVVALGAGRSVELLAAQAEELRPDVVVVADSSAATALAGRLPAGTELAVGPDALADAATLADIVVNAVVGFAGLGVTLASIGAGRRLALANKESLIAAGPVVARHLAAHPEAELVPVDSEHSAIHQCLRGGRAVEVARLLLTASGGPFRGRSRAELAGVTVEDALAHPTWKMGPKITVDSSTLMNKGLEVIEAHELFGVDYDHIEVVVHPQSIVHSMVEFCDGSTIAQLSKPDMRLPIGYALGWPDRHPAPHGCIDWATLGRLDFETPDLDAFPCLGLAFAAGRAGGTAPAALSAANEVAVEAFLAGRIPWMGIAETCKAALARHDGAEASTAADVIAADARARALARQELPRHAA
jgi:1-deoxy-D-xylulose-5-phosphate reductoisomerase